ncbi:recombinase RecT [Antarcticirhabdus aurantiaca]|uniref:Recombinase RecT n=1 Tax=Antarcticirhabdus aurantiaca TaxID=2606717 RepID=A0ACD4NKB1_9HYPH|nr:recombinase RecT [Antarcticirhabdus aurantiaca]WAJ27155.1 recombinase RecT [Jeongeuplla avenae]
MSQVAIRDQNERTSIQAVPFGREAGGGSLAPQNLGEIVRFAEVMSRADIAIPKHLRDNPGACLAVCMQAFKWEMDPFSVAQKSYKVGDQMAYEAQLIAAVINTRAGLKRRPQIEYRGAGADRQCVVTFEAIDGSTHVYESPRFAAITTKNSPLWKSDPDQQLGYYSIRAGARRHFPEVILGVYDRDELEGARDVTPTSAGRSSFASRIVDRQSATAERREGFDGAMVDLTLGTRQEPQAGAPDAIGTVAEDDAAATGEPEHERHDEAKEIEAEARQAEATTSKPARDPVLRANLIECAQKLLETANGTSEPDELERALNAATNAWKKELPANGDEVRRIYQRAHAVVTGALNVPAAVKLIAAELDLPEAEIKPRAR